MAESSSILNSVLATARSSQLVPGLTGHVRPLIFFSCLRNVAVTTFHLLNRFFQWEKIALSDRVMRQIILNCNSYIITLL